MKIYYCNLCGVKGEYTVGKTPRLCKNCADQKQKLYYEYKMRPPRPPSQEAINRICKERDNHRCVECGSTTQRLFVHHKDGHGSHKKGVEVNNSFDNLITLCPSCHIKYHHRNGDIKYQSKSEKTIKMIEYHHEHPQIRQAELARIFGLSRERVGQILGRVRKNK